MCLNRKTDLFRLCLHNFLYSLSTSQFQHRPCLPPSPQAFDWCFAPYSGWGIWPKMRPVRSGIWLSCQNAGQRRKQKDLVILLFRMCTAFTSRCSYIHRFVGAFESLWKSPSNVGSLEWPIVWKWRNLRKTAFLDLREFRFCLVRYLTLNKQFHKWKNFWIIACGWGISRVLKR